MIWDLKKRLRIMSKLRYPIIFVGDPVEIEISKIDFRTNLLMTRKQFHLTQKEVSQATGLSTQCISDIEGTGNPTLKSIIRYLDCFGYELSIRKKI